MNIFEALSANFIVLANTVLSSKIHIVAFCYV